MLYQSAFFICYLPNLILVLYSIFFSTKNENLLLITNLLMSVSSIISYIIKFSERYMREYIMNLFYSVFHSKKVEILNVALNNNSTRKKRSNSVINGPKFSIDDVTEKEEVLIQLQEITKITLDQQSAKSSIKKGRISRFPSIHYVIYPQDIYKNEKEIEFVFQRFKLIQKALNDEKTCENSENFNKTLMKKSSYFEEFESNIESIIENSIVSHCSFTFNQIRKLDQITHEEYIKSFDPFKNRDAFYDSFASGGRSGESIMFTYDKKFLLKTINKKEKLTLEQILYKYLTKLKNSNSFLTKIYNMFEICQMNENPEILIVMRNMSEFPEKLRLWRFDLKGSTVDRNVLKRNEIDLIVSQGRDIFPNEFYNQTLKDNDFDELGIELKIGDQDRERLFSSIQNDIYFLSQFNITDYSILITIYKYNQDEFEKFKNNFRYLKSIDSQVIYVISIIDFITEYDLLKRSEKAVKYVKYMFKNDKNISCQNPFDYYLRMLKYLENKLLSEK